MKVYLDFVVLLNFFFDFLLLYGTKRILKETISLKRLLLGSLVASSSILLLFFSLNSLTLFLFKVGISILIILVTFGKKNFLRNIGYFYLLSIILGGTLYLFDGSISYQNQGVLFVNHGLALNFFVMLIVTPIIIYTYIKENIQYKNVYSNMYEVEISIGRKTYKLKGMLDTGNQLKDPYKKRSVILVSSSISIQKSPFIYVPYKALNTNGAIPCFRPDRVVIENKEFSNCLIGLSKEEFMLHGADCILPNQFKEEL